MQYDKGPADSGDPIMGHAKVDMTINVCTQVLDGAALDALWAQHRMATAASPSTQLPRSLPRA